MVISLEPRCGSANPSVVLRLLTRRLGTIESEVRSRLQQLSSNQLKELAEALLDFSTTEDLVSWLQN